MTQLVEIQYFGCVGNFIMASKGRHLLFEQYESYQKMSFRNRCQVLGAGKVINLSVPLLGGRDQKQLIIEVEIDNGQDWPTRHWRTLESCYNKSPFFIHYADAVKSILFAGHKKLWELDMACFDWASSRLGLSCDCSYTKVFQKEVSGAVVDCRNKFLPANRQAFQLDAYQQVFGDGFETNLSILDLLFNLGPQSLDYLEKQSILSV